MSAPEPPPTDPFLDFFPTHERHADAVARLLALLGPLDPDGDGPFGGRRARERDERDEFVADAVDAFRRAGLFEVVVPPADGGLADLPLIYQAGGLLSSRDLSVAIALGVVALATFPLRLAGTRDQRAHWFGRVRAGDLAAVGFSEWAHGSDLAANATTARRVSDAPDAPYRLDGEKSLINNGTEAAFALVIARTGERVPETDPDARRLNAATQSFFVIDLRSDGVRPVPRFKTHGVRGADISGFRLDGVLVPPDRRVGSEGQGFRIGRRTLEISRGGVSGFAAGQAVLALRLGCRHARERRLYGGPIVALEPVIAALVRAYVEVEVMSALALKTAHVGMYAPLSSRDLTCCAKLHVPDAAFRTIADLGLVLGARGYLRDRPFERLVRDARLLPIFDGTAHIQEGEVVAAAARPAPPGAAVAARDPIASIRAYRTAWRPDADLLRADKLDWPLGRAVEVAALHAACPDLGLAPLAAGRRVLERLLERALAGAPVTALDGTDRGRLASLAARTSAVAALGERAAFDLAGGGAGAVPEARRAALRRAAAGAGLEALALAAALAPEAADSIVDPEDRRSVLAGAADARAPAVEGPLRAAVRAFDAAPER